VIELIARGRQGTGSREKVKHVEKELSVIHNKDNVNGRETVTRHEERVCEEAEQR